MSVGSSATRQLLGNNRLVAAAVPGKACFLVMFRVAWYPGEVKRPAEEGRAWSCPQWQGSREAWVRAGTATLPTSRR